jgi:hypothetical protein
MPFESAVWVGGYWVWRGNWVWASGRWMGPPQPSYVWVHPYYEHRADAVIFVDGHWSPPGVVFVPPPRTMPIVYARPAYGVVPGPRPIGPEGCFVPPPPGSRHGIIVPAPIGTAPAVVTSAPPVIAPGMRVTANVTNVNDSHVNNVLTLRVFLPATAYALAPNGTWRTTRALAGFEMSITAKPAAPSFLKNAPQRVVHLLLRAERDAQMRPRASDLAERVFAAMRDDGDDAAGLLRSPHLEFDPAADISDRVLHPRVHARFSRIALLFFCGRRARKKPGRVVARC